jgi:hypothetical protein
MASVAGRRRRPWAVFALGLGLSTVLLGGGVPRLVAAMASLQGEAALALVRSGQQPTAAGTRRIVDGRLTALDWAPSARAEIELGAVLLAMAGPLEGGPAASRRRLDGAAARLRAGLARAPADAQAWHLLASASLALQHPDDAARALRMSFRADPHTAQLSNARTLLGVKLWDRSDHDLRAAVLREMQTLFRLDPVRGIRAALRTGSLPLLRAALADDPGDAQALEIFLEEHHRAMASG